MLFCRRITRNIEILCFVCFFTFYFATMWLYKISFSEKGIFSFPIN